VANSVEHQADGSAIESDWEFALKGKFVEKSNGAITLNYCTVGARRDTGELAAYFSAYRPDLISTIPRYDKAAALLLAREYISQGRAHTLMVPLLSELTPQQYEYLKDWTDQFSKQDAVLMIEEDSWLHQRLVWKFMFNVGEIKVDAMTGEILSANIVTGRLTPKTWHRL
jgi:hypothetical protein